MSTTKPMELLLNIHSILTYHGAKSPNEILDLLENRNVPSTVEDVHKVLHSEGSGYFLIRMSTHSRNVWEVR